jgi:hypothetical protein
MIFIPFDREKALAINQAFQREKAIINDHIAHAKNPRELDEWVAMRTLLAECYRADLDAVGFPRTKVAV